MGELNLRYLDSWTLSSGAAPVGFIVLKRRIVYLDTDTLVTGSLWHLFQLLLGADIFDGLVTSVDLAIPSVFHAMGIGSSRNSTSCLLGLHAILLHVTRQQSWWF